MASRCRATVGNPCLNGAMHFRFLPCLLVLLVLSGTTCGATSKNARSYEGSIKYKDNEGEAEASDADRGVLGVRYAVGVDLLRKTHVLVVNVIKNGPAAIAGLHRGDRIVEINDIPVISLKVKEVSPLMRGEPGTNLKLTVKRGLQTLVLNLVRGNLTELPDRAFQSRVFEDAIAHERDDKIKALCESLQVQYPDIANAVREENYVTAVDALKNVTEASSPKSDELLLYGFLLAKLGKSSEATTVLKQAAPAINDRKTEQLVRDVIAGLEPKRK